MAEYIDREAFKKEIRRLSTHYLNEWDTLGVLAAVDRIPAADVRPVVRGKWIESKSIMEVLYCSECGFRTIYGAMPDGLGRNYSYCPNCGADMREES